VAPLRSVGCRPGFQRIWTHKRRNMFPDTESGQMRTQMVPLLSVINQGAAKTHRRCSGVSCAVTRRQPTMQPDSSTPMSIGASRAWRPASHPPAAASSAASAIAGSIEPSRRAAPVRISAVEHPSASAARRSPCSRRDGDRGVQATSTQMRLKTSVPFVPPKPNEFFNATSMRISRAVFAQ
jgi:hypothetical protein